MGCEHYFTSTGTSCHAIDVTSLLDLEGMGNGGIGIVKVDDIDETFNLAYDEHVFLGVQKSSNVRPLCSNFSELVEGVHVVNKSHATITGQRHVPFFELKDGIIDGKTFINKHTNNLVLIGVIDGHLANCSSHKNLIMGDGHNEVNLAVHFL